MHLSTGILAVLGLAASASAATVKVEVGKDGLKFTPDSVKASKGDVVEFHFDGEHSVVAADFKTPCTPASSGGFYSGPMPQGNKAFFSVTINSTDPIWFYCGVPGHCQAGMVGVINQGSSNTLADFKSAAEKTDSSKSPKSEFGGTVNDGSSSQSTSTMSSAGSSSTGTSTGTSTASKTSSTSASTSSGAAGHLGPMAGGSGLALIIGGLLAL